MAPDDIRTASRRNRTSIAFGVALLLVLWLHLLAALLCALATYVTYRRLLRSLSRKMALRWAELAALSLTFLAFTAFALACAEAVQALRVPGGGVPALLGYLADVLDRLHATLPPWIASRLPASTADLQRIAAQWLRANSQDLQRWGQDALRVTAHLFIGFVIGLISAFEKTPSLQFAWAADVQRGLQNLASAFADIVAAQLRIAAANTVLTGAFLFAALPAAGVHLPLSATLVAFTFVSGLVPIVGNLVSNAAILLVALTVSPTVALAALAFLLAIHKLEYFLNAHFVGQRTSVPAPVLLTFMLALEAAFGLAGLVAAPIYCAWVFREFRQPAAVS